MDASLTITLNRIRRWEGTEEAQAHALALGYSVRWDRDGNMYLADLLDDSALTSD